MRVEDRPEVKSHRSRRAKRARDCVRRDEHRDRGVERQRRLVDPRARAPRGAPLSILVALRPRQWLKNLLVVAAPLAAATLFELRTFELTAAAFGLMCLASSAGYLVNDVHDVSVDRLHPVKRWRPIASGDLGRRTALVLAVLLAVASLGLSIPLHRPGLTAVIATYLAITVSYSLWLKHESVIEIGIVSTGFVLRALAGGQATGVPLSRWFLLVAAFGSLFLVTGKRASELASSQGDPSLTRRSLGRVLVRVPPLRLAARGGSDRDRVLHVGVRAGLRNGRVDWEAISVAPFVLALLRYAQHVERGDAAEPEEIALRDRTLQLLAVMWVVLFTLAPTTDEGTTDRRNGSDGSNVVTRCC